MIGRGVAKQRVPDLPAADAASALVAGFGKREARAFVQQQMDYWTHAMARSRVDSCAAYEYWRSVLEAVEGRDAWLKGNLAACLPTAPRTTAKRQGR